MRDRFGQSFRVVGELENIESLLGKILDTFRMLTVMPCRHLNGVSSPSICLEGIVERMRYNVSHRRAGILANMLRDALEEMKRKPNVR